MKRRWKINLVLSDSETVNPRSVTSFWQARRAQKNKREVELCEAFNQECVQKTRGKLIGCE